METFLKITLCYLAVVPDSVSEMYLFYLDMQHWAMRVGFGFNAVYLLPEHLGF
ncbi:MAG: hypothetical protein O9274_03790 [Limnobacter sp.]|uniref:hypothetical protein n=1 Tax=Limnobacter sp. TaxID=2003368 RepID=UPI0022C1CBFD|nr:hypothetical protein [Limnobacter sp.]MCZ8014798.1 hypothetical protein [Limnobacter sp.]